MIVLRRVIVIFSALAAVILLSMWVAYSREFDVLLSIVLIFLAVNSFYVYFSQPTVRSSDVLGLFSNSFARVSLELQHQAQEAQIREVEADKRRLAEAERNRYKLQVAQEMLQHLRAKLPQDEAEKAKALQITHQARPADGRQPTLQAAPATGNGVLRVNGHDAAVTPPPPAPASPAPAAAHFN